MTRPDGLVLVACKPTDRDRADEWRRWWLHEHLPALARGVVTAASGWRLDAAPPPGGPGPGHSHVARLDLVGDPATAAAALDERVDRLRRDGRVHPAHAETAIDVWAAHGTEVVPLDAGTPRTAMITAEVMCTDPSRRAEWDHWYDEVHLPDMLGCGAFAAASRWTRVPRTGRGCDHLTVYEITATTAAEAVRTSAAAMPRLVAAGRTHECHTGGRAMALDREGPAE